MFQLIKTSEGIFDNNAYNLHGFNFQESKCEPLKQCEHCSFIAATLFRDRNYSVHTAHYTVHCTHVSLQCRCVIHRMSNVYVYIALVMICVCTVCVCVPTHTTHILSNIFHVIFINYNLTDETRLELLF